METEYKPEQGGYVFSSEKTKKTRRTWKDALPDKGHIKEFNEPTIRQIPVEESWLSNTEEIAMSDEERQQVKEEKEAWEKEWPEEIKETETQEDKLANIIPDWDLMTDTEKYLARELQDLKETRQRIDNAPYDWLEKKVEQAISKPEEGEVGEKFVPIKGYTSVAEEKAAREKAIKIMEQERLERAEQEKIKSFEKAFPIAKPNEEAEEYLRVAHFQRTGEHVGKFSPETIREVWLDTGRSLGPLPRDLLTLTAEQAQHLRQVNGRVYNQWVARGGKLEGEVGTGNYLKL